MIKLNVFKIFGSVKLFIFKLISMIPFCISLETKIEIIKKHCDQKITTTSLSKEYGVNTSTISTILSSKAKILEHSLSDIEIINSISNAENKDDSDSEVEDITKPKKSDFSSKDAIERINDLKDFFLNKKEDFSNVVDFLFNTENIVLEKCKTKQSSITDFVKKA
ncbi:hypothetical protein BpHYR1_052585 [Brachionus plicatilis]|uniref:HTH psq-type domain-containing protein n=1 Tax=Brachionus plicatilis TaxID=10195 RepID=A0A3M7S486_BRAPC|nr:hypothetical protein BpHYR1_052585 [Brachionus plicatilis]